MRRSEITWYVVKRKGKGKRGEREECWFLKEEFYWLEGEGKGSEERKRSVW